MRRTTMAAGLVLALGLAACGGGGGTGSPGTTEAVRQIRGTFTLTDSSSMGTPNGKTDGAICYGRGGYDDIDAGLQVVVKDSGGTVLQTGALGIGRYQPSTQYANIGDCEFSIVIDGQVPESDFYSVEVGRRGELTYSEDEMVQQDWVVSFSLG